MGGGGEIMAARGRSWVVVGAGNKFVAGRGWRWKNNIWS